MKIVFGVLVVVASVNLARGVDAQHIRRGPADLASPKTHLLGQAGSLVPGVGALGPFGDLDGDGDVDLLSDTGVCLGDGFGRFLGPRPLELAAEARVGLFHADGDARLDLLTRTHLYLGDGEGGFLDASTNLPPGLTADAAVLEDLDRDGDVDILAVRWRALPLDVEVRLALNDGNGAFVDASTGLPQPPDTGYPIAVAAGDVDGDADLDLALATSVLVLWRNDGAAHFTADPGALPATGERAQALVLVDVDGDGDLDLVLGNARYGSASLLRNDGAGTFSVGSLPTFDATTATGWGRSRVATRRGVRRTSATAGRGWWRSGISTRTAGWTSSRRRRSCSAGRRGFSRGRTPCCPRCPRIASTCSRCRRPATSLWGTWTAMGTWTPTWPDRSAPSVPSCRTTACGSTTAPARSPTRRRRGFRRETRRSGASPPSSSSSSSTGTATSTPTSPARGRPRPSCTSTTAAARSSTSRSASPNPSRPPDRGTRCSSPTSTSMGTSTFSRPRPCT